MTFGIDDLGKVITAAKFIWGKYQDWQKNNKEAGEIAERMKYLNEDFLPAIEKLNKKDQSDISLIQKNLQTLYQNFTEYARYIENLFQVKIPNLENNENSDPIIDENIGRKGFFTRTKKTVVKVLSAKEINAKLQKIEEKLERNKNDIMDAVNVNTNQTTHQVVAKVDTTNQKLDNLTEIVQAGYVDPEEKKAKQAAEEAYALALAQYRKYLRNPENKSLLDPVIQILTDYTKTKTCNLINRPCFELLALAYLEQKNIAAMREAFDNIIYINGEIQHATPVYQLLNGVLIYERYREGKQNGNDFLDQAFLEFEKIYQNPKRKDYLEFREETLLTYLVKSGHGTLGKPEAGRMIEEHIPMIEKVVKEKLSDKGKLYYELGKLLLTYRKRGIAMANFGDSKIPKGLIQRRNIESYDERGNPRPEIHPDLLLYAQTSSLACFHIIEFYRRHLLGHHDCENALRQFMQQSLPYAEKILAWSENPQEKVQVKPYHLAIAKHVKALALWYGQQGDFRDLSIGREVAKIFREVGELFLQSPSSSKKSYQFMQCIIDEVFDSAQRFYKSQPEVFSEFIGYCLFDRTGKYKEHVHKHDQFMAGIRGFFMEYPHEREKFLQYRTHIRF